MFEQLGLLLRGAAVGERQVSQHLVLAQQLGNLIHGQRRLFGDPALFKQWAGCRQAVAYFRVDELAQAKMTALAHDHTYQQSLGWPGQAVEGVEKGALFIRQQVGIALTYPGECGAEIAEVVELGR